MQRPKIAQELWENFNLLSELSDIRQEDVALAQKIAQGDKDAMRKLYDQHAGPLNSFVRNWLADPTQAADLVHETMMAVWKNAHKFEGRSSLKSWVFTIARNKSIDSNRKNSRLSYTDEVPDMASDDASTEDKIYAAQNAKGLRSALEKLSENHRRVLHLAFFQDLKYDEIAEIENCPVGTVKTRILHAKKNLLSIMKKDKINWTFFTFLTT